MNISLDWNHPSVSLEMKLPWFCFQPIFRPPKQTKLSFQGMQDTFCQADYDPTDGGNISLWEISHHSKIEGKFWENFYHVFYLAPSSLKSQPAVSGTSVGICCLNYLQKYISWTLWDTAWGRRWIWMKLILICLSVSFFSFREERHMLYEPSTLLNI